MLYNTNFTSVNADDIYDGQTLYVEDSENLKLSFRGRFGEIEIQKDMKLVGNRYQIEYDYFKIRIHKIITDVICMFEGFSGQVHLYQLPTDNPNYGSKIGSHNLDNFL